MSFEGNMAGFEERFVEFLNLLCLLIGGMFVLFALTAVMVSTSQSLSYSAMAIAFLVFPPAVGQVFKPDSFKPKAPILLKKNN
jgi:hypothetical protein